MSAPARHQALERYLTLATWGLWGNHKRTVRMELESHIRHKAWKYQVEGFNEPIAIDKALKDLGQPHVISAGMNGVYTMPYLIRQTALVTLLTSLGVVSFSSSAQIASSTRVPVLECLNSNAKHFKVDNFSIPCESGSVWVLKSDLQKALEPQGVKFGQTTQDWTFGKGRDLSTIELPSGTVIALRDLGDWSFGPKTVLPAYSKEFVSLTQLVSSLSDSNSEIRLEGWRQPRISIGSVNLQLGSLSSGFPTSAFYRDFINPRIYWKVSSKTTGSEVGGTSAFSFGYLSTQQSITVSDKPERVYVLLRIAALKRNTRSLNIAQFHIAPVRADGSLKFSPLPHSKINLVSSYNDLQPSKAGAPARAILLRLNTDISDSGKIFEIIDPKTVSLRATHLIAKDMTPDDFCSDHGGVNAKLAGQWQGQFSVVWSKARPVKGWLSATMNKSGFVEGRIQTQHQSQPGKQLGAICADGFAYISYRYGFESIVVSKGKFKLEQDGSLKGRTQEVWNGKVISDYEFILRRK
jgi:hypothetical protein